MVRLKSNRSNARLISLQCSLDLSWCPSMIVYFMYITQRKRKALAWFKDPISVTDVLVSLMQLQLVFNLLVFDTIIQVVL